VREDRAGSTNAVLTSKKGGLFVLIDLCACCERRALDAIDDRRVRFDPFDRRATVTGRSREKRDDRSDQECPGRGTQWHGELATVDAAGTLARWRTDATRQQCGLDAL